ncbi:hypothetical protein HA397_26720, partial [Escherichia coli]|nr:hypothetical protein [Escherichia coli]
MLKSIYVLAAMAALATPGWAFDAALPGLWDQATVYHGGGCRKSSPPGQC